MANESGPDEITSKINHLISYRRSWAIVCILALLTIVSFVDRQVFGVLIDDMQRDLHLTDVQFGLLLGPAFIVTYNIALLLLAFLIDRWNRKYLLVGGILLWSSMTFMSAFANDFAHLVVLRAGLAIGEALLGPSAVALIGDLYRREHRAAPMALYIAGSVLGQNGAAFFGAGALQAGHSGMLVPLLGDLDAWRLALILVAIPGFLLGLAFLFIAREPVRGATATGDVERSREKETLREHLSMHWQIYLMLPIAMGLLNMLAVSTTLWGPTYLSRAFGTSPVMAGYSIGGVSIIAGCAGVLLIPLILRRIGSRREPSLVMIEIAVVSTMVAVPSLLLFGNAPSLLVAMIALAAAMFALTSTFSLVSQFVQLRTPSRLRAKVTSGMLFIVFLLSAGIGPIVVPLIAKYLLGAGALGSAIGLMGIVSLLVVVPLLLALRRRLQIERPSS